MYYCDSIMNSMFENYKKFNHNLHYDKMATRRNSYRTFLREECIAKRSYYSTLKNFRETVKKYMKEKNYIWAEQLLNNLATIIYDDSDKFHMTNWDLVQLYCCHMYCSVWMNSTSLSSGFSTESGYRLPIIQYLRAVVCFLKKQYKQAILYISETRELLKRDKYYPTDMLNENIMPEYNETIMKERLRILEIICGCEIRKKETRENGNRELTMALFINSKFGMENSFELVPYDVCRDCSYYHINVLHYDNEITQMKVLDEQEEICTKSSKSCRDSNTQTLQNPLETTATQTEHEIDYARKTYSLVKDLKIRMNNVSSLENKLNELNRNMADIENQHEIAVDNLRKKIQDDQTIISDLTKQLNTLEVKLSDEKMENKNLRVVFQKQIETHYRTDTNIYKMLERTFSTGIAVLKSTEELFDSDSWLEKYQQTLKQHLQKIKKAKTSLQEFYTNLEKDKFTNISNPNTLNPWPNIPCGALNMNTILLPKLTELAKTIKKSDQKIKKLEDKSRELEANKLSTVETTHIQTDLTETINESDRKIKEFEDESNHQEVNKLSTVETTHIQTDLTEIINESDRKIKEFEDESNHQEVNKLSTVETTHIQTDLTETINESDRKIKEFEDESHHQEVNKLSTVETTHIQTDLTETINESDRKIKEFEDESNHQEVNKLSTVETTHIQTDLTETINESDRKIKEFEDESNDHEVNKQSPEDTAHNQQASSNPTEDDRCMSSPTKFSDTSESDFEVISHCDSPTHTQHNSNKSLLEYLETDLRDEDFTVLNILSKICEENSGSLIGLEHGKLVDDIRNRLKSESD